MTTTSAETRDFTTTTLAGEVVVKLTFTQWYEKVSAVVVRLSGVSADDLPDFDSWSMWNDGTLPYIAAREALEEADFPFDESY